MAHPILETLVYGAAYIRLLASHVRRPMRPFRHRTVGGISRAVLLVPGFLGPSSVVVPLQERFERESVPAFSVNPALLSAVAFEAVEGLVVARIRELRAEYPALQRLDLIGHSMGGLVAYEVMQHPLLDGLDVRLVTLGSPFRGTWAALMGCPFSLAAYELLPLHPRCRKRNARTFSRTTPFLSIAGEHDVLAPAERCHHPAARNMTLPVDHAGLILKKSVFRAIADFLKQ